jgi:O-acetylhomoserine (thiol)-lyase
MSPMAAFQILQGIETLPLRMARHIANTREVLDFLVTQTGEEGAVASVVHPDLPDHPDHELASRLMPRGSSSVFAFNLKGGREAGRKFIEALSVFSHLANVGDAKSLVIHPASTTHFRMADDALIAAGIHPGTIRLSIGLEHAGDLIDDLKRGLNAAAKA